MATEIVSEIKVYDDSEDPQDEIVVYFTGDFVERNFEEFNDEYVHMSRDQARELRDKLTEVLA
jgi:hypothetical protein